MLTLSIPVSYQLPTLPYITHTNKDMIFFLVMRKGELIKQRKHQKIKSKILSNLFNEKYGFKLGEFNNTTGFESRVN